VERTTILTFGLVTSENALQVDKMAAYNGESVTSGVHPHGKRKKKQDTDCIVLWVVATAKSGMATLHKFHTERRSSAP